MSELNRLRFLYEESARAVLLVAQCQPRIVKIKWPCGCAAVGASFSQLHLRREDCDIHGLRSTRTVRLVTSSSRAASALRAERGPDARRETARTLPVRCHPKHSEVIP
jgi:hypothetical protein